LLKAFDGPQSGRDLPVDGVITLADAEAVERAVRPRSGKKKKKKKKIGPKKIPGCAARSG